MKTKKNRFNNLLKFGVFLFGISLLLWNCEKVEVDIGEDISNIDIQINAKTVSFSKAKSFFHKKQKNVHSFERSNNSLLLNPEWNTLTHNQIPYTEALLTKAEVSVNREGNYTSELFFIEMDGVIKNVIVTIWKENVDENGLVIDARVFFNKTDGTFMDAYQIENGKFTKKLVPKTNNILEASFFSFFQTENPDCWNTDTLDPNGTTFDGFSLTAYTTSTSYGSVSHYTLIGGSTGTTNSSNSGPLGSEGGSISNNRITQATSTIFTVILDENQKCPDGFVKNSDNVCVENPCNKVTNLFNDYSNLKQELINLKGFTSASTERGRYKLTSSNFIQTPPTGSDGYVNIPIPTTGQYVMFAHTHNSPANSTLSVPSFEDIEAMAALLKLGKIDASNFVFFLMTADGTNYAITIDDPTQFLKVFATQYDIGFDYDLGVNRYNMRVKYYLGKESEDSSIIEDPLIKENNLDKLTDEKLFLDFLDATQMGLSLFEVNDTFDEFTRVIHNKTTDSVDENNCN